MLEIDDDPVGLGDGAERHRLAQLRDDPDEGASPFVYGKALTFTTSRSSADSSRVRRSFSGICAPAISTTTFAGSPESTIAKSGFDGGADLEPGRRIERAAGDVGDRVQRGHRPRSPPRPGGP